MLISFLQVEVQRQSCLKSLLERALLELELELELGSLQVLEFRLGEVEVHLLLPPLLPPPLLLPLRLHPGADWSSLAFLL